MNVGDERSMSCWMQDAPAIEASPLQSDQTCDVVVIGSGIAGLSTAYEMSRFGRSMSSEPFESSFTPREIVSELDRYIVGQSAAKRAVAIALRNRWRRRQLSEELRRQVTPKNILLIGPTGVGKTEIARCLARLVGAPFVKVEATKYTEVGYY